MSDANVPVGDGDQNAGGAGSEGGNQKESVAYGTYDRAVRDLKKHREELAAVKADNERLAAEKKAREENELRQKEDWKRILEIREQELAQARSEQAQYSQQIAQFVKKTAFVKAIGGNFNPAYERLIDFDQIPIDPTTNGIDEMGLTKYVDTFKKTFKEVITPLPGPTPSFAAPQGAPSQGESESDKMKRLAKFF